MRLTGAARRRARLLVLTLVATLTCAFAVGGGAAAAPPQTVVVITFDNQWADQLTAARSLRAHGMAGTFYVISGWIGGTDRMTLDDLRTLSSWGNEIGGKTVSNVNLTTTADDEARREVCTGRQVLESYGFRVTSFAYPFAEFSARHEPLVRECGFNSGRGVGNLADPTPAGAAGCSAPACPYAESLPPADPYALRTPTDGQVTTTLTDLTTQVSNAVSGGGGLLAFSFHQICAPGTAGCGSVYSVSPHAFDDFLTWLQDQAGNGVVVRTMDQAIGGEHRPVVSAPSPAPPAAGVQGLANPTLTRADPFAADQPDCWTPTGFGANTRTWSWSRTGGHNGGQATVRLSDYVSGDAKLVSRMDLGRCAPSAVPGHRYRIGAYYTSTLPVSFTLYQRSATGTWSYWTASPTLARASTWTLGSWLTPPVPASATAVAIGLAIAGNGRVSVSDHSLVDLGAGPPPAAPPGTNALVNPTLTTPDGDGTGPHCWQRAGYGTNTPSWSWSRTGGQVGGRATIVMSRWASGDAKWVPTMDAGNCAPTVTPGLTYTLAASYTATGPVFWTVYRRDPTGAWSYWTQSPALPAASSRARATFTTPAVPAGVDGLSFGLTLAGNGTLRTSDYSMVANPAGALR